MGYHLCAVAESTGVMRLEHESGSLLISRAFVGTLLDPRHAQPDYHPYLQRA